MPNNHHPFIVVFPKEASGEFGKRWLNERFCPLCGERDTFDYVNEEGDGDQEWVEVECTNSSCGWKGVVYWDIIKEFAGFEDANSRTFVNPRGEVLNR